VFPATADAGFRPYPNGFQINNTGTQYLTPNGNCMGMTTFALFYWNRFGDTQALWSDFPVTNPDPPYSVQDLIATRAQIAQSAYWGSIGQQLTSGNVQQTLFIPYSVYLAKLAITGGNPVAARTGQLVGDGHSVLFVAFDLQRFYYYDPNFPGHPGDPQGGLHSVTYSDLTGIDPYPDDGRFVLWTIFGSPSFGSGDSYAQILSEAQGGFAASQNITITNPKSNDNIIMYQTELDATLGGNLNPLVRAYFWRNGLSNFELTPVVGGSIVYNLPVKAGQNTLLLIAGIQDFSGELDNTLANAATLLRRFNGPPPSLLHAQLTWKQFDTDVDLYATDPNLETAWYQNKTTTNGLTLQFDNTTGFGPEDTVLAPPNTPLEGTYSVRVHYYSDHGTGQTTDGNVTVTLYEGDQQKQVGPQTKHWQLSISGKQATTANGQPCCNDQPGSSGTDWTAPLISADVVGRKIQ
jgi:hypothetical protein